jgi:hypothetical protein
MEGRDVSKHSEDQGITLPMCGRGRLGERFPYVAGVARSSYDPLSTTAASYIAAG